MKYLILLVGVIMIIASTTGCNVKTGSDFITALDQAEQIYKAQRQLYMEMRRIIINTEGIDKETMNKLKKADEVMQKADVKLRELWNNEAIRRGQDLHKAIEISNSSLELIKTAIKLLK